MTSLRGLDRLQLLMGVLVSLATVVACAGAVSIGVRVGVGALAGAAFFVGLVLLFVRLPHVGLALTVALLAFVPALKVFVTPELGALKDVAVVAASLAAAGLAIFDGRRPDQWTLRLVGILLAIYVIDAGGGNGAAWRQGVRLVAEPLLLLVACMTLPDPRRNLRWLVGALIGCAVVASLYGITQQQIGPDRLVSFGYRYDVEVRFIGSNLRSFGTSDDSFGYVGLLTMAIAAVLFARRRTAWSTAAFGVLMLGLYFAYVRTAFLVVAALVGLAVARRGRGVSALLVVAATVLLGVCLVVMSSSGREERSYVVPTVTGGTQVTSSPGVVNVVLNGRVSAWQAALGDEPRFWLLGRGVGAVGTAAQRAQVSYLPAGEARGNALAVDSGYVAAVADVGFLGLAVLLALLARLLALAVIGTRFNIDGGWLALGAVFGLMVDATSRASFTGVPTAYVAMALAGVGLAAVRAEVGTRHAGWA